MYRGLVLCGLIGLVLGWGGHGAWAESGFSAGEVEMLSTYLREKKVSRAQIEQIFASPALRKIEKVVSRNGINQEHDRIYKKFLTPYAINLARRFRNRSGRILNRVERDYGVPAEIIVGILLIETRFGAVKLPYRVFNVFATLAVAGLPENIAFHYQRIRKYYPALEKASFSKRLKRKQMWALQQMGALVQIATGQNRDVFLVKGSYAGAFGIPQFLPTSYQAWAVDGDGDRKIDLDNLADAVASVAAYLKAQGWRAQTDFEKKRRAVWKYNHSWPYVNAVFGISRRVSLPSKKKPVRSQTSSKSPAQAFSPPIAMFF